MRPWGEYEVATSSNDQNWSISKTMSGNCFVFFYTTIFFLEYYFCFFDEYINIFVKLKINSSKFFIQIENYFHSLGLVFYFKWFLRLRFLNLVWNLENISFLSCRIFSMSKETLQISLVWTHLLRNRNNWKAS